MKRLALTLLLALTAVHAYGQTTLTVNSTTGAIAGPVAASTFKTNNSIQPLDSDLTSWAAITRASGFDTFSATSTSANWKALITDENAPDGASSKVIMALGSLSIASGKTATFSNTLTFAGTDSSTLNVGAGGTLGSAAFSASTAFIASTALDTDGTLAANSDSNVASQKAGKTYADAIATRLKVGVVTGTFDGGGSALATGTTTVPFTVPYSGTITGWSISVDTGTATFKVWKKADGTAIPTISDLINTSGVAISTGTHIRSSTVSDFGANTAVTAGDQIIIALTTVASATKAIFELEITK